MTSRQQFISDMIKKYKKDNPEELKAFKQIMKDKRKKLRDKNLATFEGKQERLAFRFPEKLYNLLNMSLDNPPFLEEKGETKWLARRFPEFHVSYEH